MTTNAHNLKQLEPQSEGTSALTAPINPSEDITSITPLFEVMGPVNQSAQMLVATFFPG